MGKESPSKTQQKGSGSWWVAVLHWANTRYFFN